MLSRAIKKGLNLENSVLSMRKKYDNGNDFEKKGEFVFRKIKFD